MMVIELYLSKLGGLKGFYFANIFVLPFTNTRMR